MAKLTITGGEPLIGEWKVQGMKNAATKLIVACLLTEEQCVLHNVPRVRDVLNIVDLVVSLGAEVVWLDPHTVSIHAEHLSPATLDRAAMKSMRSSVALLAPLLVRFRDFVLPEPGGDNIGRRPLDSNFAGLRALGATIDVVEDGYHISTTGLNPSTIILPEFSVLATENTLMAAATLRGKTVVKIAALEPSVQDLIGFLRAMGADIEFVGPHVIAITGKNKLHGAEYTVSPDNLEIGTLAIAAAITRGELNITPVMPDHIDFVVAKLQSIGIELSLGSDTLRVSAGKKRNAFKLQTMIFPGFPTDLQAPMAVLATTCEGTSLIHDPLYEGRLGHIQELVKMGANAVICDPHRVLITGRTPLFGREVPSLDIRAGATLVLAGLIAQGETILNGVEMLERGYEKFGERLTAVGARITQEF